MNYKNLFLLNVLPIFLIFIGCSNSQQALRPSGTMYVNEVQLSPLVSGQVLEVKKSEGDVIEKGDTLLIIDTEILQIQKKQSEAQWNEIQAQKQVLEAQIKQVELQLKHTETKIQRQLELFASGSATQQSIDDLMLQKDLQTQQLNGFKAQRTANEALKNRVEAQIALQQKQISDGILKAPISGKVLTRAVEVGETVSPQTIVFTLANDQTLEMRVYLTQSEIANLNVGKKVKVFVDAFPKRVFEGTIAVISSKAEFTPKNVQTKNLRSTLVYAVKINIPNEEQLLLNGMPAEVEW